MDQPYVSFSCWLYILEAVERSESHLSHHYPIFRALLQFVLQSIHSIYIPTKSQVTAWMQQMGLGIDTNQAEASAPTNNNNSDQTDFAERFSPQTFAELLAHLDQDQEKPKEKPKQKRAVEVKSCIWEVLETMKALQVWRPYQLMFPRDLYKKVEKRVDTMLRGFLDRLSDAPLVKKQVRRCGSCGGVLLEPRKCSRCRRIFYCGPVCQRKHWPTHAEQCTYDVD